MARSRFLISLVLIIFLSGCAQKLWYHPSKNEQGFYSDSLECERMALQMHPDKPPAPERQRATKTVCRDTFGDSFECTTEDATYGRYAGVADAGKDTGEAWAAVGVTIARDKTEERCMYSKGWDLREAQ